jgi:saccharopine dehydrogenase (NAD+, L-lysine-forming)
MAKESNKRLLLYGAYGYTGRLTAELAAAKRLDVVLAGCNKDELRALGDRLSLPTRAVAVNESDRLFEALSDIACVVHMAGPFAITSAPMLSACIATQTDYIDITGEIEVFESLWSRESEIRRAGITAVPGAGFDVVPTDCARRRAARVGKRLSRFSANRDSPGVDACTLPAGGSDRCA